MGRLPPESPHRHTPGEEFIDVPESDEAEGVDFSDLKAELNKDLERPEFPPMVHVEEGILPPWLAILLFIGICFAFIGMIAVSLYKNIH